MTDRLTIYNNALLIAGERALSSLTEDREPRRLLDQVWNSNGVKKCLSQGQWKFAIRAMMIDYDPSIEPDFGYRRAFEKPTDWVVTSAVCQDEYFRQPLLGYFDEAQYWYADLDTIYVRYVSDDAGYGLDLNKWPDLFEEFVSTFFASKIVVKLANGQDKLKNIFGLLKKAKSEAKSADAMADPTKFPAPGEWVRARYRSQRRDGGSRGGLIG